CANASAELSALPAPRLLRAQAFELETAVNTVFLDTGRGLYRSGTGVDYRQTSNAVALAFQIVPGELAEQVAANLIADVERRGDHHDCGHIGVRYLLPVLSAHGRGDLALRVLANPTAPGWRAWLEAGHSTFMEMWHEPRSCSHYFMGTPVTWIHEHAAGLRRGQPGRRPRASLGAGGGARRNAGPGAAAGHRLAAGAGDAHRQLVSPAPQAGAPAPPGARERRTSAGSGMAGPDGRCDDHDLDRSAAEVDLRGCEGSERADVRCLQTLGALLDVELNALVLLEVTTTGARNRAEVRENVGGAVLGGDEAVALVGVEPGDDASSHGDIPSLS